jgi:O-antigen biosynthesis protein
VAGGAAPAYPIGDIGALGSTASESSAELGVPEVALLLVLDRPDPRWLRRCLRSVTGQTTGAWQLSIAVVDRSTPEIEAVLAEELGRLSPGQARFEMCPPGTGDAEAAVAALARSTSPAVALLGPHDQLAPDTLALLATALTDADLAYGDEDQMDDEGLLSEPALKPGWSPDFLLSRSYLGRPVALRRAVVEEAGGIRPLEGGDWEHDLLLRVTERTDRVTHVAEVLCHRQAGTGTDTEDGHLNDTGSAAVTEALRRRGEAGRVEPGPLSDTWAVRRHPKGRPTVSAIVPFRDGAAFLRACVDSVTATADGFDLELVLVDNGSVEPETLTLVERFATREDVTVVHDDRPFNWAALNNAATDAARGDILLFLNNDIEARRPGWLSVLAAHALRPDVAVAGARLLYPGGRVQHAGVVVGIGGAAGHVLVGLPGDRPGYLGMAVLARDCSAVTGACLATRRTVFDDLGRFDEDLGLDLNDIDFCLRARQRGMRVVYEPLAELVHYESPSRGTSGSVDDIARFIDRWEDLITAGDPFLNRNLTRVDSSCALRGPDEEGWWQDWRSTLGRS